MRTITIVDNVMLVQSDVIQGKASVHVITIASITSLIHEAINIFTGSTMYQGNDGCVRDIVLYPDILPPRTNYRVMPSGGWHFR